MKALSQKQMLKIKTNNTEFEFDEISKTLNGDLVNADVSKIDETTYHILIDNKSYTVELLEKSENSKHQIILVNGQKNQIEIKDKFDLLLENLGMNNLTKSKINVLKAPMPGLVLKILIAEGQEIKKGDGLIVLEAMKMENIIKSSGDCTIKKINVVVKQAVEKNHVLMEFE